MADNASDEITMRLETAVVSLNGLLAILALPSLPSGELPCVGVFMNGSTDSSHCKSNMQMKRKSLFMKKMKLTNPHNPHIFKTED
ncbi:MAG: hypothetical protein ACKO85_00995, partial [Isosphaeraceae bacterium]